MSRASRHGGASCAAGRLSRPWGSAAARGRVRPRGRAGPAASRAPALLSAPLGARLLKIALKQACAARGDARMWRCLARQGIYVRGAKGEIGTRSPASCNGSSVVSVSTHPALWRSDGPPSGVKPPGAGAAAAHGRRPHCAAPAGGRQAGPGDEPSPAHRVRRPMRHVRRQARASAVRGGPGRGALPRAKHHGRRPARL
jgi:hypothetical protein